MKNMIHIEINVENKTEKFSGDWEKMTLLEVFQQLGMTQVHAPCGGKGTCGKCLVEVSGRGKVLACQTLCEDDMQIILEPAQKSRILEDGRCEIYPADGSHALVAACDIGTTTVVCHLLDGRTGERLGTVSEANAQRNFGADVISRIQAAKGSGLRRMQFAIVNQINQMITGLMKQAGKVGKVDVLAVAGNTVMDHLLCGLSPESIGVAPFEPLSKFGTMVQGSRIGISRCNYVYVIPAVSGYVGGDIVSGLIAAGIREKAGTSGNEMMQNQTVDCDHTDACGFSQKRNFRNAVEGSRTDKVNADDGQAEILFLDIGTNGEMVLGKAGDYVCCATAAGPAFEGAEITMGMPASDGAISEVHVENDRIVCSVIGDRTPVGICGSGLIDALAVFLQTGLMDETGFLHQKEDVPATWKDYAGNDADGACIYLTDQVRITQADVRNIQLAKAAIAAGIRILLKEKKMSVLDIDQVILAGGFGSFLKKESAAKIGLIPEELLNRTCSVGNAAGEGAVSAALSAEARTEMEQVQKEMRYIELSAHADFGDWFVQEMSF